MIIFPAIDLKDGECVRLYKGDFSTVGKVADNPLKTAGAFRISGAVWVHMVDLDGAKTGVRDNRRIILDVAAHSGLKVEAGGGFRDMSSIADYIDNGVERIILGSAAITNISLVREAVREYADKIAVGIDARNGMAAGNGWLTDSGVNYIELAKKLEQTGVKYIIFTDISRDGTLSGPNYEQLDALESAVTCKITASGGIRNIDDIQKLSGMGLYGAICGKSLYSGTLSLKTAIMKGGGQHAG